MIRAGEELGYNYGYGMERSGDFPCTCKATHCAGYILAEAYWGLLKKRKSVSCSGSATQVMLAR